MVFLDFPILRRKGRQPPPIVSSTALARVQASVRTVSSCLGAPLLRSLISTWQKATLRPRSGLPHLVHEEPRLLVLLFPITWGVVQSLMQGASNNIGLQGSVPMIFALAIPVGAIWGLLQVHVMSGAIWTIARRDGERLPFRRVRHVVSLASAPTAYALLAWLVAALLVGRAAFVDPAVLGADSVAPVDMLRLTVLYLGTAVCAIWSLVLLVFALRELQGTTTIRAIGTLVGSMAIVFAVSFAAILLLIVFMVGMSRAGGIH